jgi:DNA mismatch endonuclease (patch repair protein)
MGDKDAGEDSQDHLSPDERSQLMSRINSTETEPEKLTRSLLHQAGYRFRKNVSDLPGTPDIVLPKYETVIFVHGCYWHRHDCRKGNSVPSTNREFWVNKFERNIERDKETYRNLREANWNILVVWECELNDNPESEVEGLIDQIEKYS